ncbi:Homoserine/homoserine lactone efflux protein [Roseivivax jejudonensis]|uniref:Homoserine/homoserine lactone efflux protein n=1 Tax=Roseivivax jejudonensis TaxID=1529041 RepID=A0A1X6YB59_9RHOB|nr:LysE family translocator [Roseivivax jejudonensis]SLN16082.1 Homoserine/homoserine lactone efflux protein [Roseivivax jejudonensis]
MIALLPDPAGLLGFLGAGLILNLTPGADVMFALASGARGGPRAGIAAALGVSLGCLFHVALTAGGVAALLAASPAAFDAIRYAGAAYLLWLAVRSWRAGLATAEARAGGGLAAIGRGALTNILNPKVALFILAFLPQFADPARGPVWAQLLLLGGLFALTAFFVTALYGAAGGALRTRLARRARLLNRIAAGVFAGLAARLALA